MNQDLYIKLKRSLTNFDFDKPSIFIELYNKSRKTGHGLRFREYVSYAKKMGVSSGVSRVVINGETGVMRSLSYDPKADQYIKGLFPVLDTCPNCNGSGLVEIKLN